MFSSLQLALLGYRDSSILQCPQHVYALGCPVSLSQMPGLLLLHSSLSESPALGFTFFPVSAQFKVCLHNSGISALVVAHLNVYMCKQQLWLDVFIQELVIFLNSRFNALTQKNDYMLMELWRTGQMRKGVWKQKVSSLSLYDTEIATWSASG